MKTGTTQKHYIAKYQVKLVRDGSLPSDRRTIRTPEDAYAILEPYFSELPSEHFLAVFLTTKNGILGISCISSGSLNASIVHPRELFQRAILANSASIILSHNHPSGDPTPSPEDVSLTRKLCEAGKILDIIVLDHVIIGDNRFISLKERGVL